MNGCKEDNVMKRLSIIAVTAIAALLSASCNKSIETPMVPAPQGSIILDLDIAGFEGAGDTKAVKNDWVKGDKLNLWFDDWNYKEQANNPTPDLVITYDGTKWTADELAAGRSLKPSGKLRALYEGYNDLTKYVSTLSSGSLDCLLTPNLVGSCRAYPNRVMCASFGDVSYTYTSNKLTATIAKWEMYSAFKVLVRGLASAAAGDYALQVKNVTTDEYFGNGGGFFLMPGSDCVFSGCLSGNSDGTVIGVPDADEVAFYYRYCECSNADIEFQLFKKNAGGEFEKTAKTPKFTGKTLVYDVFKITGIVIDNSNFE